MMLFNNNDARLQPWRSPSSAAEKMGATAVVRLHARSHAVVERGDDRQHFWGDAEAFEDGP